MHRISTAPSTPTTAEDSGDDQPGRLLQFVSSSTGWLVNQRTNGQILGTTDGGRSWWTSYNAPAPTQTNTEEIVSIDFENSSDGWALLREQGLMATHDGGHTWSAPAEPTQGGIATFTFTGPDDGWAITNQGALLRTLDGGQRWRHLSTPVQAITLCATAEVHLWFGGGGGDVYSFGGASWSISLSGSVAPDIVNSVGPKDKVPAPWLICSADTTWAFYDYGESAGSQPNALERTLDGGRNWALVSTSEVARGATALPPNNLVVPEVFDLGATGASRAWFLGWCGACGTGTDPAMTGTASVTTASDASTFSNFSIPTAGVGALPVDVSFSDRDHGCVVLEELSASSASKLVALTTNDGGTTWNVANPNVSAAG